MKHAAEAWQHLEEIVARLRSPEGCPWDRAQTHASLRPYVVEEAHEVVAAIEAQDWDNLAEELGDLLLQVALHAQIASESGAFTLTDVVARLNEKLIRRHPHVFGQPGDATGAAREGAARTAAGAAPGDSGTAAQAGRRPHTAAEVSLRWEQLKAQERAERGKPSGSWLAGVAPGLSALLAAHKMQQKAAEVGFDFPDARAAWDKLREEEEEFREAWRSGELPAMEREWGDLAFALVNVARLTGIYPENALAAANRRFAARFQDMEGKAAAAGRPLPGLTAGEWEELWQEAKANEQARR